MGRWDGASKGQLRVAAAWRWHDLLAEKQFRAISDRYICVRYEDLILPPENVGKRLSDFLDVAIDVNTITSGELSSLGGANSSFGDNIIGLSTAPLCRWKETMEPKCMATVEFIAGKVCMTKYGYEKAVFQLPSFVERFYLQQFVFLYSCLKEFRMMLFPLVRR